VRGLLFVSQAVVSATEGTYGIAAIAVGGGCSFHLAWRAIFGTGDQPPPIVVADTVLDAGGAEGGFGALDAERGRILWTFPTDAETVAPLIEVDGTVIGADVAGYVYAFRIPSCHRLGSVGARACAR
jgi:hypothetical protein